MAEPILTAHELRKSYGQNYAVKGVSFSMFRGEIFGLLGPNGAGKTTTISMLTGLFAPTSGRIVVNGLDLGTSTNAVKARIGFVPQELALYPTLSARDNLNFFGSIYGLRGSRLRERVQVALELVGLADRANSAVQTFSGGMKRRVNIAAGLLHEPDIVFLDEPTVGVDPQSRNAILESVEGLNRAGLTILYTTHYMEEAQRLCHRIAIMDEGQIIAMDSPEALVRSLGGGLIHIDVVGDAVSQNGQGLLETQLAQRPSVKSAVLRNGRIEIEAHRVQEALIDALDITNRTDTRITSLKILEPNLETVFLRLTGKGLRD